MRAVFGVAIVVVPTWVPCECHQVFATFEWSERQ